MNKKILWILLLILPIVLTAQTAVSDSTSKNGFGMGGGVGTVFIGDKMYSQIRLMPELTLGKFGIGIDAELLIDSEGNVRKEDWDDWRDYVNKIYYIRYGRRGDNFFGRIGGFPSYSLGHGLVMKDYTNMLRYPEVRQIGLQLGGKLPLAGMEVEAFTSDVTKNEIVAARVSVQPLNVTGIPLLKDLKFGATAARDNNQIKGLLDSDNDNYPDYYDDYPFDKDKHNEVDENIDYWQGIYQEIEGDTTGFHNWFESSQYLVRNPSFDSLGTKEITVVGLDYEIPLVKGNLFSLGNYGEAAKILEHKMGFIFPGFYAKFLIFNANLEFRIYQDDFIPSFFDRIYDEQRATISNDSVFVKEDLLKDAIASKGWFGSLTTNIFNTLYFTVSYEDMYGQDNINRRSLWAKTTLNTKAIPKISRAEVNYSQTGFDKLRYFKTPSSLIEGIIAYNLGGSTNLVGRYQERFADYDGNGKIEGNDETIKTMTFGVEFKF